MSYLKDVSCIRCGAPLGDNLYYMGCPQCACEAGNVNYTTVYDLRHATAADLDCPGEPGIFRYRAFLPLKDDTKAVSLHEGRTPLIRLNRLGERLGIANLYAKDESKNPTLSYKDRLTSVVMTKAMEDGAPAVTISSTGNHGGSAAAYATMVDLPCIIFTTPQVPDTMKTLMQVYGAYLVVVPTRGDRWKLMQQCVQAWNWVPVSGFMDPPIGSNCYGIDGYKTIAFELYEQMGKKAPAFIVMPTAYSDGIYGTYKGMCDLHEMGLIERLPKMVASEVYGSMEKTLALHSDYPVRTHSEWSVSFSIGGSCCTYQGLEAVRKSHGFARSSDDDETMKMQIQLAQLEGIYAEAASVTTLVAAKKLAAEGHITDADTVVAVLTSTGLKDPSSTKAYMPTPPFIEPNIQSLRKVLKNTYGLDM